MVRHRRNPVVESRMVTNIVTRNKLLSVPEGAYWAPKNLRVD